MQPGSRPPADGDLSAPDRDRRALTGGAAFAAGSLVVIGIEFAALVVLARLLTPADFGVVAMATVFFALIGKVKGFGLASAVVQRAEADPALLSRLFWLNARWNAGLALIIAAAAPLLAWLYGEPRLLLIVPAIGAAAVLLALSAIHEGRVQRAFGHAGLSAVAVAVALAGAAAAVVAALQGWGVWALVVQQAVAKAGTAAGVLLLARWKPLAPAAARAAAPDDAAVRELTGYGSRLSAANVISHLGRDLDFVLIGALTGGAALGLYHKAYRIAALPFKKVYRPCISVAFAKFSRLQDDPGRYRASLRRAVLLMMTAICPLMAGLGLLAPQAVRVLLGTQWDGAATLLRLLLPGTFCNGVLLVLKWLYKSEGRTGELLNWTLLSAPLLAAGVVTAAVLTGGHPTAVAIGFDCAAAALVPLGLALYLRRSPTRLRDLVRPTLGPLTAAGLAATAVAPLLPPVGDVPHSILTGLIVAPAFAVLYAAAWLLLPGGRTRRAEMRTILTPLLTRAA